MEYLISCSYIGGKGLQFPQYFYLFHFIMVADTPSLNKWDLFLWVYCPGMTLLLIDTLAPEAALFLLSGSRK